MRGHELGRSKSGDAGILIYIGARNTVLLPSTCSQSWNYGLVASTAPPDTDFESVKTRARLDAYYVSHVGAWLDIRILFATLLRVLGFSCSAAGKLSALSRISTIAEANLNRDTLPDVGKNLEK